MEPTSYNFEAKINEARTAVAREFLADLATECQGVAGIVSAAISEAKNSDGSAESMLRVAEAVHAAAQGLTAIAQDAAVQSTVVYDTPLRGAATAVGTSPNTITRWRERGRAPRPVSSPTQWWVNEQDVLDTGDTPDVGVDSVHGQQPQVSPEFDDE